MRTQWVGFGVIAVCGLLTAATATAAPAAISEGARCEIIKLKATVKELKDKAQCYERSLKGNVPVAQSCFARAESKRERIFSRAEERGGCKTTKDGATLGARIDSFLQDATRALSGSAAAPKKATVAPAEEAKTPDAGVQKTQQPATDAPPAAPAKPADDATAKTPAKKG